MRNFRQTPWLAGAALGFAVSCAGNGLIISTLGAVLAAHSSIDPDMGGPVIEVGLGVAVPTATFNGLLLGTRWLLEGLGAPLVGRMIDRVGWQRVAPAVFGLSSLNGAIAFGLLGSAAAGGGGGGGACRTRAGMAWATSPDAPR